MCVCVCVCARARARVCPWNFFWKGWGGVKFLFKLKNSDRQTHSQSRDPNEHVDNNINKTPCRATQTSDQKHIKGSTERFLIRQNKRECKFSRESSSSKPQTIQKQTNHLAAASWMLPEGCDDFTVYDYTLTVRLFWHTSFWKHRTGSS